MAEPDRMLAEGDPIATAMYRQYQVSMPNFRLEPPEIEALLEYMQRETERLRALEAPAGHAAGPHDEARAGGATRGRVQ